jgi:hypothetical protein
MKTIQPTKRTSFSPPLQVWPRRTMERRNLQKANKEKQGLPIRLREN